MRTIATNIAQNNKKQDDTNAVLLLGSVSTGNIHPESDLDIVVIKNQEKPLIQRKQSTIDEIEIDLWEHSTYYYERLFKQDWKPDEMFLYSLFLNILQTCDILYDKNSKFIEYQKMALRWEWSESCKDFIQSKYDNTTLKMENLHPSGLEASLYQKKLLLLETCLMLFEQGMPVSNRNKDLYKRHVELSKSNNFEDIWGIPSVENLSELVEQGIAFFYSEIRNRELFTELYDARKHIENGEFFLSLISLQNGAYYVGRAGLVKRGVKLKKKGYFNPESEVELIQKSRETWPEFYTYYNRIHDSMMK